MRDTLSECQTIADRDPERAARLIGTRASTTRPSIEISQSQLDVIPDARRRGLRIDERPPARDRHPVRSNAVCVHRNPTMWVPLDRNARARLIFAALAIETKTKAKGRTDGAIGRSGLVILQVLLSYASLSASGRCDPALTTIADKARCCVQTVVSALERLASIGLITVTRRWLRVRDPQTGVMVSRQITNAYAFASATTRFWIPVLAPLSRTVTATSRRTLRRGIAYFKGLFQQGHADEPGLSTALFNAA